MLCMGWADVAVRNPHLHATASACVLARDQDGRYSRSSLGVSLRINSKVHVLLDGNWKVLVSLKDADGLPLLVTFFMVLYHEKTQMT
jgi:hypothetical protein